MTKYKYITIWTSYDKVEQKMTELSQEGYEYDNCYFVIVRMKKTNTKPKKYKFIYDKNFSPEVMEYYKAAGWHLHKIKLTYFLRLAEGDENSYPIFSDEETEYEIIKYRVLRFFYTMLLGVIMSFLLIRFSKQVDACTGEIVGEFVTGLFGGIGGFGLGGLIIFIPKFFINFARYIAVVSPSRFGFIAKITSSISSFAILSNKDFIFNSFGVIPFKGSSLPFKTW